MRFLQYIVAKKRRLSGFYDGPRVRAKFDEWFYPTSQLQRLWAEGSGVLLDPGFDRSNRPVIGITAAQRDTEQGPEIWLKAPYVQAVYLAGGAPMIIAPGEPHWESVLQALDGVVLSGGAMDIPPDLYGQEVLGRLDEPDRIRSTMEISIARHCWERKIPTLGICGGMQVMNVALGGTLIQDLPTGPGCVAHEQPTDSREAAHSIEVDTGSFPWLRSDEMVNSTHHQAVDRMPRALTATAWAEDGVVEALRGGAGQQFFAGVQWHPELLGDCRLYSALVGACG